MIVRVENMKRCRDMGMVMIVKKVGDWKGNEHRTKDMSVSKDFNER